MLLWRGLSSQESISHVLPWRSPLTLAKPTWTTDHQYRSAFGDTFTYGGPPLRLRRFRQNRSDMPVISASEGACLKSAPHPLVREHAERLMRGGNITNFEAVLAMLPEAIDIGSPAPMKEKEA